MWMRDRIMTRFTKKSWKAAGHHLGRLTAIILGGSLLNGSAMANTATGCTLIDDFARADAFVWRSVNDNVMGGRSSGSGRIVDEHLRFEGAINTNGGGFASLRRPLTEVQLAGVSYLRLRILQDARRYRIVLRSDQTYFGRSIAYQADIPPTEPDQWQEVDIPLSLLSPSIFGRQVPAPRFALPRARTLGLIIADGIDGPFQLKVDRIMACTTDRS